MKIVSSGAAAILAAVITVGSPALAAPDGTCDAARRPFVLLAFGERPPPPALTATLLRDVRAGLMEADVCEAADTPRGAPVATLEIAARDEAHLYYYVLEVRDALTKKRVGREVDLATVPDDGRSVALAIAAAELLHAAWAELLLVNAAERASASTKAAATELSERMRGAAAQAKTAPASTPASHLGARGAFEVFATGQALAGGDVFYRRRVIGPWTLGAAFVARGGLPVTAAHGTIAASAIGGQLETGVEVVRRGRLGLAVDADASVTRVQFRGTPAAGAMGGSYDGIGVVAHGGLAASADVARAVRLEARAAGGGALAGVVPLDGGVRAGGVHGAAFLGTLGVGAVF